MTTIVRRDDRSEEADTDVSVKWPPDAAPEVRLVSAGL